MSGWFWPTAEVGQDEYRGAGMRAEAAGRAIRGIISATDPKQIREAMKLTIANKVLACTIVSVVFCAGCATTATTTQMQNLKTESSQVPIGPARYAVASGECVDLGQHELQGKVGASMSHDLQLLAKEIDSLVTYNGGDSYILHTWEWVTVGDWGSTAPLVDITVLNCDGTYNIATKSVQRQVEKSRSLSSDDSFRYECYTYDYPAQHVLTLPVAPLNAAVAEVTVTFHGEQLTATYLRKGLTQFWMFEEDLYLQIDPDLSAKYMDFQGAAEGEERTPDAVFECKKLGANQNLGEIKSSSTGPSGVRGDPMPLGTSSTIEAMILGEFSGWDGETTVKLTNGQIWKQVEYHYHYHYAFNPRVWITNSGGTYKMRVEGTQVEVGVMRLQ